MEFFGWESGMLHDSHISWLTSYEAIEDICVTYGLY